MKQLYLLVLLLSFGSIALGQNGAIYNQWYLISYEDSEGNSTAVGSISPGIIPSLWIQGDTEDNSILLFEGTAACNPYNGAFQYDDSTDTLVFQSLSIDSQPCEAESHTTFENEYFAILSLEGQIQYGIIYDAEDSIEDLELYYDNGAILRFSENPPLSNDDPSISVFTLYPNPATDIVYINLKVETPVKVSIYTTLGRQVVAPTNSRQLDISHLSSGMYLVEVVSDGQKSVKKFIKK
ncbi:T9SS type A sorting domain-containing protein [Luteirhabdus pelagi]|uniref:T9SS type A sorting domain-containing protein n=1 Tax=Luteirhabdus pelagi TaxID=2792783 RepID=UPI00193A5622|nr:T9SS type A sorting domain-containing protein [Luteirhabdus pelagi]